MAPESRDEVRQRIDSLYDQAENATGNFNATRAMNGGSRSRGVPLFKRPRRDDPGLDNIAREWFDGARSRLGPSVPAALPSDRQPARPGPRRPVSAMAADLLGQLEGSGPSRPELPAGSSANSDVEVVRELPERPKLELTAGSPAALPPGPSSAPKAPAPAAPQRATPGTSKTKSQLKIAKAREMLSQRTGQRAIAALEPAAPAPAPAAQSPWPTPEAQVPAQQWPAPAGMPGQYGDTGSFGTDALTGTGAFPAMTVTDTGAIPVVPATDTGSFRVMTPGAAQPMSPADTGGFRIMTPGATSTFPAVTAMDAGATPPASPGDTGSFRVMTPGATSTFPAVTAMDAGATPPASPGDTGSFRVMTPGATGTFPMPDDTGAFPTAAPTNTGAFPTAAPSDTGAFPTAAPAVFAAPLPGPMDTGSFPGSAPAATAAYVSAPPAAAETGYPAAGYGMSAPAAMPSADFGTGAFPGAPAAGMGAYATGTQPAAAAYATAPAMPASQAPTPTAVIPTAVTDPPWAMMASPAAMTAPPMAMATAAPVAPDPLPTAAPVPAAPPVVTVPVPTAPPVVTAPLPTAPPAAAAATFAPGTFTDTGSLLRPGVAAEPGKAMKALAFARAQIGRPCVWGATGPESYDCSSLTQAAWRAAGVSLPRSAPDQTFAGTPVTLAAIEPGDLVFFFDNDSHVGVYAGNGMMVHAPSPGASIREESIYNAGESAIHRVVRPA
ncbi:NlpC/P60 family protein [Streptomyces sp. NPDC051105]|uniref:C40 family peptidase n=1 Tax=Streptomyces sp. NPDC051105 TaxID=3154843 RepID=UPI003447F0FC